MQLTYAPEGTTPRTWEWAPEKIRAAEAEAIEANTGKRFAEWADDCMNGGARAMHAFLYVMLRRDLPSLTWDQVDFSMSEVTWGLGDYEVAEQRALLEPLARDRKLNDGRLRYLQELRDQSPHLDHIYAEPDQTAVGAASDPTPPPSEPEPAPTPPDALPGSDSAAPTSEPATSGPSLATSTAPPTSTTSSSSATSPPA